MPFDGPHHTYPGNPDPLTFGESGDRGVVIATIDSDGTIARERRSVAVTTVTDIPVDVTGATNAGDVRDKVTEALGDLEGVARVRLHGELSEDVDLQLADLKEIESNLDAILPEIGTIHLAYDLDSITAEQTVRGEFVASVLAAGLSEDECQRIITAGLRAFDGRNDLEVR
jgi:DNA repair exonuclease SbcCD nuclease subunit